MVTPFQGRRDEDLDGVDLPCVEERAQTWPPPSTRTLVMPRRPSSSSKDTIGTRPCPGKRDDLTAEPGELVAVAGLGSLGDRDEDRDLARRLDQAARNRQPRRAVQHDPAGNVGRGAER